MLIPAKGEETDRRLRVIEAPGYGIVGKSVTLRVAIEDLGVPRIPAGPSANLTIRRDGEPPQSRACRSAPSSGSRCRSPAPARRCRNVRRVRCPARSPTINNRAVVEINGVRDRLRVLLISGEPHPGERTWRRLLKADPSVDLVHFTILRPPEKDDLTPLNELALIAFPVRELFLDKIERIRPDHPRPVPEPRPAAAALPAPTSPSYVREGGALLLSVGPEFSGPTSLAATPLGSVLPGGPARANAVVDGAFRPRVTRSRPAPSGHRGPGRRQPAGSPDGTPGLGPVVSPHRAGPMSTARC